MTEPLTKSAKICTGCDGRGDLSIHDVEGTCGRCDGTGREPTTKRPTR